MPPLLVGMRPALCRREPSLGIPPRLCTFFPVVQALCTECTQFPLFEETLRTAGPLRAARESLARWDRGTSSSEFLVNRCNVL
jgi:hypothetical protein